MATDSESSDLACEDAREYLANHPVEQGRMYYNAHTGLYHRVTAVDDDGVFRDRPLKPEPDAVVDGDTETLSINEAADRFEKGDFTLISERVIEEPERVIAEFASVELEEKSQQVAGTMPYGKIPGIETHHDLYAASFLHQCARYETIQGVPVLEVLVPVVEDALDYYEESESIIDAGNAAAWNHVEVALDETLQPILLEELRSEVDLVADEIKHYADRLVVRDRPSRADAYLGALLLRTIEEYIYEALGRITTTDSDTQTVNGGMDDA